MIQQIINWLIIDLSGLAVQIFFLITIVLMLIDKQKPPIATSLMTGVALIVLGLGGSFNASAVSIMSSINGFLWLSVGWQRYRQKTIQPANLS